MGKKVGVLVAQGLDVPNFFKDVPNFVMDVINHGNGDRCPISSLIGYIKFDQGCT